MEDPIDHLKDSAQGVRLTREAAERIRARLTLHMHEHPIAAQPVHSPYHRFSIRSPFLSWLRRPVAALMVILLVGFGGASTYAAAGALPGEPLYAVKVKVIEPVKGFLAITPEAKAEMKASIALMRVKEVEALAAKNTFTPEKGTKVKEGFDTSFGEARATIQKLKNENPAAAQKLEDSLVASLDAREAALHTFATTTATTSSATAAEVSSFAKHMKNRVHGKVQGASDEKGNNGSSEGKGKGASDDAIELLVATTTTSTTIETSTSSEDILPETKGNGRGLLRSLGL